MEDENLKYWLGFARLNIFRHQDFFRVRKKFNAIENFWQASLLELQKAQLPEKQIASFIEKRRTISLEKEIETLCQARINIITFDNVDYPYLLKEISCPPLILFYKGNKQILSEHLFAIVGTRRFSNYGRIVTNDITQQVLENNLVTTSGLALGIDTLVHQKCVENNFPTVAVLGSGLDDFNIYPRSNYSLAQEIICKGGLLISEYPPGTQALKQHFPARNRLISGLSLGTLVTEARQKSGALITAHFALEQNREVFAIPGPINQQTSDGTNNLIKKGAKLVHDVSDILAELNLPQKKLHQATRNLIPTTEEELIILKHLTSEPRHINEISLRSQKSITYINAQLLILEMKGRVKNLGNMHYILNT